VTRAAAGGRPVLDHVVLATPNLAGAVNDVARVLGVVAARGGRHPGLGTRNALVDLGGGAYLELIGPDCEQPDPERGRPFGVDGLTTARVVTWAVACTDLDERVARARDRGHDPGSPRAMSRRTGEGDTLQWRLALRDTPAYGGLVPFLIDWGVTPHPTSRGLPRVELVSLTGHHPDPAAVGSALDALDVELTVLPARDAALSLRVRGVHGEVELR
jgi:hypothetical protein